MLHGMSDLGVLAIAAEQNRILVTHDFRTMPNTLRSSCRQEVRAPECSS
jgi:predicted nuclease of predicted toxin-antitoxin system